MITRAATGADGSLVPSDPRVTLYRSLMLAEDADAEVISAVYRKLAQRYHPDIDSNAAAARRMAEINDAYQTLRDPVKRKQYDEWLAARRDRRQGDRLIRQAADVPYGAAGRPVGMATGSVLEFGRYSGWTLGQIRLHDPEFLEWLVRAPAGRQHREEIQLLLAKRSA